MLCSVPLGTMQYGGYKSIPMYLYLGTCSVVASSNKYVSKTVSSFDLFSYIYQ